MSESIIYRGRHYEREDTSVIADGQQYATGLWVPHHLDVEERPLLASDFYLGSGVRDLKDCQEIVSNPNRTPAAQRFPNDRWIRSQGQVGSCAGYAGAWTLTRARVDMGQPFVPLSGESLYAQTNGGRDQGSALEANIKAMVTTGVAPEGLNTAGRFYTERTLPEAAKRERHRFRVHEWYQIRSEMELAIAVATGFIVSVAIHVGRNWSRLNGDVLVGDRGPGNHAVGVDDLRFASGRPQFRMFNSHGRQWGQGGTAWTTWDAHYSSTARYHVFYAVRSAILDPTAPKPPAIQG